MTDQLLPPNATALERAVDSAAAARLDALPIIIRRLWNPATCPPAWLGLLAWTLSVDYWRSDWAEATKRAAIAASPRQHRIKGTRAAIRAAVETLGLPVRIVSWFDPGGSGVPYTAFVESDLAGPTDADLVARAADIRGQVARAQSARDHITIRLATTTGGGFARVAHLNRPLTLARLGVEVP